LQLPGAAAVDLHGHDVVALRVEGCNDRRRRPDRDVVLRAAAAGEHGHPDPPIAHGQGVVDVESATYTVTVEPGLTLLPPGGSVATTVPSGVVGSLGRHFDSTGFRPASCSCLRAVW